MVHMHFCKNTTYREGVGDVGFATATNLPIMGLFCEKVGALNEQYLRAMEVVCDLLLKARERAVEVAGPVLLGTGSGF